MGRESEASHDLIPWLDEPGGARYTLCKHWIFRPDELVASLEILGTDPRRPPHFLEGRGCGDNQLAAEGFKGKALPGAASSRYLVTVQDGSKR